MSDHSPAAYEARQAKEIKRLKFVMETAQNMLRHPTDLFTLVNVANYLNQELAKSPFKDDYPTTPVPLTYDEISSLIDVLQDEERESKDTDFQPLINKLRGYHKRD